MQLNVNKRDGPSRIGELIIDDYKIITPNIFFVNTSRFKAPDFADIIVTNNNLDRKKPILRISSDFFSASADKVDDDLMVNEFKIFSKDLPKELLISISNSKKKSKESCSIIPANKEIIEEIVKNNSASLFIVSNAFQLFHQQSKFIDFITELRERIGYQKMIYLPFVGDPSSFALLIYIGIDFFDSTSAIIAARNNLLLLPTGRYNINDITEIPCSCPSCSKFKGKPSELGFNQILNHNYYALLDEIKQIRNAISIGCLRELVETRIRMNPGLTALLRNLDFNHYVFLEQRTPIIRKNKLIATTKEALYRPEIKRFQERTINRYYKPKSAKILLLLPCSAKKPYSFSKSHKFFKEKINLLSNPNVIHEVIITSPLGIVPRELELTYPASKYDIPVTGIWDEDEKKIVRELLDQYLQSNNYDKIIVHLPFAISKFLEKCFKKSINTCVDIPTSEESLDKLSNVLKKQIERYEKVNTQLREKENILSLAAYQFGREIAEKLLDGCIVKGKYPYQKIFFNNKQLGMITKERGLISLTIDGALKISDSKQYWVRIYDDFDLIGSVFAPGVKDSDDSIRVGDEVVVFKNKKPCAVGVAMMSGQEMKESLHGEAIKIRHRI